VAETLIKKIRKVRMKMNNPILVPCTADTWVLAAEAIKQGVIQRKNSSPKYYWTYRVPGDPAPVGLSEGIALFDKNDNERIPQTTGLDLWVYAQGAAGSVRIDDTPLESDVNIQDQRTNPVDLLFSRDLDQTTLAIAPTIGSNTITLTDASAVVPEVTWIELWDLIIVGTVKIPFFMQAQVRATPGGGVVEMYMPVGLPFDPATTVVRVVETDMSIPTIATFNTPLIYSIDPPKLIGTELFVDFDETRFITHMIHPSSGDDSKYGDITGGIANGMYFRNRGTLPGPITVYTNLFNIKKNGDWRERTYDVNYDDKALGTGEGSTTTRKTFNGSDKSGVVVPLRASLNEATEAVLRDNISALTRQHMVGNGHVVAP
jgi:hypothetical protein